MIPGPPSRDLQPDSWLEAFEVQRVLEGEADLTLGEDPLVLMPEAR